MPDDAVTITQIANQLKISPKVAHARLRRAKGVLSRLATRVGPRRRTRDGRQAPVEGVVARHQLIPVHDLTEQSMNPQSPLADAERFAREE